MAYYNNGNNNSYGNRQFQQRNQGYPQQQIQPIGAKTVDGNYVEEAEKVITAVRGDPNGKNLTTSQLRNLLSLTADIYNQAERCQDENLPQELKDKIEYLKVRFIYESGRTASVKSLVEYANLLEKLKNVQGKKSAFIRFNRYMEALVAYHRYQGGKDN